MDGKRKIRISKTDDYDTAISMINQKHTCIVITGDAYDKLHKSIEKDQKNSKSARRAGAFTGVVGTTALALAHPVLGAINLGAGLLSFVSSFGGLSGALKEYGANDMEEEKTMALLRLRGKYAYNPATDVIVNENGEVEEVTFK